MRDGWLIAGSRPGDCGQPAASAHENTSAARPDTGRNGDVSSGAAGRLDERPIAGGRVRRGVLGRAGRSRPVNGHSLSRGTGDVPIGPWGDHTDMRRWSRVWPLAALLMLAGAVVLAVLYVLRSRNQESATKILQTVVALLVACGPVVVALMRLRPGAGPSRTLDGHLQELIYWPTLHVSVRPCTPVKRPNLTRKFRPTCRPVSWPPWSRHSRWEAVSATAPLLSFGPAGT
jgi:hypothetical protein